MNDRSRHHNHRRPMRAFATWTDSSRVREEIAAIEARLDQIGHDGDCAYEKAMVRFFEHQLVLRREWLDTL